MLAAHGIIVSYETVRQWARKFGQGFANQIRRRLPATGDKWHLDEVMLTIAGVKHWLWRAVDQNGMVLDILVQSRRDTQAARRLLCKLMKRQCRAPRVMITDRLAGSIAELGQELPTGDGRRRLLLLLPAPKLPVRYRPIPTVMAAGHGRMEVPAGYDRRQGIEQGRAMGR